MRILLHDNQLCERGTTTSMLDYARALRNKDHEVEISYWQQALGNVPTVIARVSKEFPVFSHAEQFDISKEAKDFDAAYFIKAGNDDGLIVPGIHNLVHAVFQEYEPHGSRYTYISKWLADSMRDKMRRRVGESDVAPSTGEAAERSGCLNARDFQYLDLIVDVAIPQNGMRSQLGIPAEAFVILRFGGQDTFDIHWVQETVVLLLDQNPNWYFVGLNTQRFTNHARALFIPMVMDPVEKASIIACADVFLTARGHGEAFGVAIAEALQLGIPVLAWEGGVDRNHTHMLSGLGGLFRKPWDLRFRLRRLAKGKDPASAMRRMERGNQYRPENIVPSLESMLGIEV